tara:strand:+ start:121 stop:330 length:210 start_codon:yes stop_codon:yes gene_type:complete
VITADLLAAKREDMIRQRDNALAVYQQALGAVQLLDHLITISGDERESLTLGELAKSMGAESAEIEEGA